MTLDCGRLPVRRGRRLAGNPLWLSAVNILASARDALFYFRMKILRQLRPAFTCALGLSLGCVSQQRAEAAGPTLNSKEFLVYIGTYTGPKSKGIYVSRFT